MRLGAEQPSESRTRLTAHPAPVGELRLFCALALGVLSFALLQSLIVPVLGRIGNELHADQTATSWVLTAYLLSAAVFTPLLGRLGDSYGKRGALIFALSALAMGSLLAAMTRSIGLLIVARIVQGAGGAVVPLSLGLIRSQVSRAQRAALAVVTSVSSLGFGLGLIAAGPVIDVMGYPWLFLAPGLMTCVSLALAWAWVPRVDGDHMGRLPVLPAVLLAAGIVVFLLGVSNLPHDGWSDPRSLIMIAAGFGSLACWARWDLVSAAPFIGLRRLAQRPVVAGNLVTVLAGFCTFSSFAFLPQFLQSPPQRGYGFGASVTESGLILLPCVAGSFITGFLVGLLARWVGFRWTILSGAGLMSGAFLAMAAWHSHPAQIVAATTVQGLGSGLILAGSASLVVLSVPAAQSGTASGVNANLRTLGGAVGTTVFAAILTATAIGGVSTERGYSIALILLGAVMSLACACGALIPSGGQHPAAMVALSIAAATPALAPAGEEISFAPDERSGPPGRAQG